MPWSQPLPGFLITAPPSVCVPDVMSTSKQHLCVPGPLRECRSIRSGASGLPYCCAPFVCVSEVSKLLPVWRHNKPKTKNQFIVCLYFCVCECLLQNNNHKTKHNNNTTSKQHPFVRGPLRECRSIRSGASGFPYYCTPLVCISVVIGLLAV